MTSDFVVRFQGKTSALFNRNVCNKVTGLGDIGFLKIDMLYQDPLSRALLGEDGGGSVGLTTSLFDI